MNPNCQKQFTYTHTRTHQVWCIKSYFVFSQGVDFTKLCAPSKKTSAHGFWQKIHRSISSTNVQFYNPSLQGKFVLNLPNTCDIRQICALFAKHRLPKIASHLVRANKCWWNWPKVEPIRVENFTHKKKIYGSNFFTSPRLVNDDI